MSMLYDIFLYTLINVVSFLHKYLSYVECWWNNISLNCDISFETLKPFSMYKTTFINLIFCRNQGWTSHLWARIYNNSLYQAHKVKAHPMHFINHFVDAGLKFFCRIHCCFEFDSSQLSKIQYEQPMMHQYIQTHHSLPSGKTTQSVLISSTISMHSSFFTNIPPSFSSSPNAAFLLMISARH